MIRKLPKLKADEKNIATARHVQLLERGIAWLDTGTPEGMLNAAQYVEAVQSRQGLYIACPEEIAWQQGFISDAQMTAIGRELSMTEYGRYLLGLVEKGERGNL